MEKTIQKPKSNNDSKKEGDSFITRPPVVVVLGHVDSGKTSILDAIRKTHIADKESGGITQHIGAYQIEKDNKKVTFLDTPGHEAFSQMRSRGAKIADIAILVIDTCRGVEEQTKEAISHIKKAEIPLVVALNKVDRPEANIEKTKGELGKEGILVESMGGKVPSVEISAKTGKGIEDILEVILLIAEMENLRTDISESVKGTIIESYLESKTGLISTAIVSEGTLRAGDIIGTQSAFGKVKNLENFRGKLIEKALPADPVIILGFENSPKVGESFQIFSSTEDAQNFVKPKEQREKNKNIEVGPDQKVLNLVIKTDVLGSLEAIEGVLEELPQGKIILRILGSGVGDINEADLKLSRSSRALILGFRVKIPQFTKTLAEREKIKIMTFEIIYELVEGVRKFMEKIMTPETVKVNLGKIKILAVFLNEKNRQIIGGKVAEGEIKKGAAVEVLRGEEFIGKGKLINLQRNKKDADKVQRGDECGMLYEGDTKIEEGDILAAFQEETKKAEL